jgi:hypothetical protein
VPLYTPRDGAEPDVVWHLIIESYRYVTGRQEDAAAWRRPAGRVHDGTRAATSGVRPDGVRAGLP